MIDNDQSGIDQAEGAGSPEAQVVQEAEVNMGSEASINLQSVTADTVHVADKIVNYYEQVSSDVRYAFLTFESFQCFSVEQSFRLKRETVADLSEVDRLAEFLSSRRLAVVFGDPDLGKGALVTLAALELMNQEPGRVWRCPPCAPEVKIDWQRLLTKKEATLPQVLLMHNAWSRANPSLATWLRDLEGSSCDDLSARLAAINTTLVLITDRAPISPIDRLLQLDILFEVKRPCPELIQKGLRILAENAVRRRPATGETLAFVLKLLDDETPRITERLATLPAIARFVESHLFEVAEGQSNLEAALQSVNDLSGWLLRDLAKSLEAWSFALALVLAQPSPDSNGATWSVLLPLSRAIERGLRRHLHSASEPRSLESLVADPSWLEIVRAETQHEPFPGIDRVRFRDPTYPQRLWDVLLGPGRGLLTQLMPLIGDLAERNETDREVRFCAARALGRLGEADPRFQVFQRIGRWAETAPPNSVHVLLGHLISGCLDSKSGPYREASWHQFRIHSLANDREAWAGAIASREIGGYYCDLASSAIASLLRTHLGPNLKWRLAESASILLRQKQNDLRGKPMVETARGRKAPSRMFALTHLTGALFPTERPRMALEAIQFSLIGLCFSRGTLRILCSLREQLENQNIDLLPVLPLLCLRSKGILDVIERHPVPFPSSDPFGQTLSCSRLLLEAIFESGGPKQLGRFLELLYFDAGLLPNLIASPIRAELLDIAESWIVATDQPAEVRRVARAVFQILLNSSSQELREALTERLRHERYGPEGSHADFIEEFCAPA